MVLIIFDKILEVKKDTSNFILNVYFLMVNYFKKFSFLDDTVEDIFDLTN